MKLLYTLLFAFFIAGCDLLQPEDVYGCTNPTACNFNYDANIFDDTCDYDTCADECGIPNGDNSTCVDLCGVPNGDNTTCSGCTDETAFNYDIAATNDDGSCSYGISGTVRDEGGNPIPNAAILFTFTNGSPLSDGMRRSMSQDSVPTEFILSHNYPNPFNPYTVIDFSIASESYVNIWIEESCGDTVIVLVDEYKSSGYHSISWDANDTNGNQVVDGVYIIKMKALDFIAEKFLTLLVLDYSHLDSIEGQNYHAMTDENGFFTTPLDCLPFGIETMQTDAVGDELGFMTIQNKVEIWVIHPDHEPHSTDFIDVDPQLGVNKEITLP